MNDGTQKSIVAGSEATSAKPPASINPAVMAPLASNATTPPSQSVAMVHANFNCFERRGI